MGNGSPLIVLTLSQSVEKVPMGLKKKAFTLTNVVMEKDRDITKRYN